MKTIDLTKGNQIVSYGMDWNEISNWAQDLTKDSTIKVKVEENQIHVWSEYGCTAICRVKDAFSLISVDRIEPIDEKT